MLPIIGLIAIAAAALALGWGANQTGEVTISWFGSIVSFHPAFGLAALVGLILLLMLVARVWGAFRYRSDFFGARRRLRRQAAARGSSAAALAAYLAGENVEAAKLAKRALRTSQEDWPALAVLALTGDTGAQVRLMKDGDTEAVGSVAEFRCNRTLATSERLARVRPNSPDAWASVLRERARARDWLGAREALERWKAVVPGGGFGSAWQEASLDYAEGLEAVEKADPQNAEQFFRAALAIEPRFHLAADGLSRILLRQGDRGGAERILEKSWAALQNPAIAFSYAELVPLESAGERLARFERLVSSAPGAPESRLALAAQSLAAGDASRALELVGPLLAEKPVRARAAMLALDAHRRLGSEPPPHETWPEAALHGEQEPDWACLACRTHSPDWHLFCENCDEAGLLVWGPAGKQFGRSGRQLVAP